MNQWKKITKDILDVDNKRSNKIWQTKVFVMRHSNRFKFNTQQQVNICWVGLVEYSNHYIRFGKLNKIPSIAGYRVAKPELRTG